MGMYMTANLMLGVVGKLKNEEADFQEIREIIEEKYDDNFLSPLSSIVFDPTYKVSDHIDDEDARIMVGFNIGCTNDFINDFNDGSSLEDKVKMANHHVTKELITELEEQFPDIEWGAIEYRNVVTVG